MVFGSLQDPLYSIPLGSPTDLQKRPYVHARRAPAAWHRRCTAAATSPCCCLGGYTGWVYRVGNTGYLPSQHPLCSRSPPASQRPQGAGPAQGAGWAGSREGGRTGTLRNTLNIRHSGTQERPPGPPPPSSQPLGGWGRGPGSPGKRARFRSLFHKVSQNGKVSPKLVNKA